MSDIRLLPNDDDEVARGLRSLYAAPAGDAYWNELESRIMARVADVELGWWTELDRWVRPAIAAAAVLLARRGRRDVPRAPGGSRHRRRQHVVVAIRTGIDGDSAGAGQDDREARIRYPVRLFYPGALMQRSKQQALMFLLGAVLVGGALGFRPTGTSATRSSSSQFGPRTRILRRVWVCRSSSARRSTRSRSSRIARCGASSRRTTPLLESMRARFQAQRDSVFTKEQMAKLDCAPKEMQARREAEQAKEPKRTCSGN